jgi:hypothetical protein
MPYTISRNEKDEYCVYKKDADGAPMGETLGCHPSQDKASAQIGAIEASEAKDYTPADDPIAIPRPTQNETHYLMKSVVKETCDGCRWFTKDYCHIIENNPEDIHGAGYCDRHEAKAVENEPPGPDPEPIPVPPDLAVPVEPIPDDSITGYVAPDNNAKSFLRAIKEKLMGGMKPGNTVVKGISGS